MLLMPRNGVLDNISFINQNKINMKRIVLFFTMLVLAGTLVHAQERRVSGTVTDASDGSTLPGVTITIQGTTQGTITDIDGAYELRVTPESVLVFSFIGMVTEEVRVGDRSVINVAMRRDIATLQETVVVGYGVQQRRDVSGAISSVSGDAIRTIPVQSFDQALQGKASGVSLTLPNAVLGNPPIIRIRGVNSISGSSSPLYIIDGVPVFTGEMGRSDAAVNPLGDISPSDIESIEVLKDASATAIYGSRAANGVILITTRRGAEGDMRVNYDVNTGWSATHRFWDLANAEQYVHTKNTARANAGLSDAYFLAYDQNGDLIDTEWYDYVYRTGFQQSHSLSISGGSARTQYYFGANYQDTEGIVRTNNYQRMSARMNIDHEMTDWLKFGANVSYANTYTESPNTGSIGGTSTFSTAGLGRLAVVTAPNVPAFATLDEDGNLISTDGDYNINWNANAVGRLENTQSVGFFHPVWIQDNNYSMSEGDRVIGNLSMQVEPIKGLVFRSVFGLDNHGLETQQFWAPGHADGQSWNGRVFHYFDRRTRWNWTNTLNYMFTAAEKLNVNMMIGSEEQHSNFNGWSAYRMDLGDPFFTRFQGNWLEEDTPFWMLFENYFISFFGRVNMNWDSKYFVEFSGRRDGYSGLADGNKYGNFGGASLMWNLTREDFFATSALGDFFSDLRLKASYGKVGNITGVSSYASLFLYGAGTFNDDATLFFTQAGNAALEWETSSKIDFGLSFGILNDQLQFDLGYFNNDVDGLILAVPQSPSKGIPGNVLPQNIGALMNQGFEFSMTSYNITRRDFSWVTDFNFTYTKNEVTELAEGVPYLTGTAHLETTNRTLVGYPIGMIWGVETLGVCPETGRRMFQRINEDGSTTVVYYGHGSNWPDGQAGWREADGTESRALNIDDDGVPLGNPLPKYYGGLENNIRYKNWDFNLGLTFALDFYVYNGTISGLRDHRPGWQYEEYVYHNFWREPGDETDIPKPMWGDNVSNGNTMVQSQNVQRGDYLKVRNVSLGYTIQNDALRNLGISSARIYCQVFNLYTLTGYSGSDPEISSMGDTNLIPGVDRNSVPQARTISFGANISF